MTPALAAQHLKLRRNGRRSWRGACPVHGGSDAFIMTEAPDGDTLFHCHAGCDFRDIVRELETRGIMKPRPQRNTPPASRKLPAAPASVAPEPAPLDWSPLAEAIHANCLPVQGSIVETYLCRRKCALPDSDDVGFLPRIEGHGFPSLCASYPAMLCMITDALTAKPISLHFTFLEPDGSGKAKIDRPKRLLAGHRKKGGVIRLVNDAEVTHGLGLAEGVETALAVMAQGWKPVWACIDSGNMKSFPALPFSLTIFADADDVGLQAARALADRTGAAIVAPKVDDWNYSQEVAA